MHVHDDDSSCHQALRFYSCSVFAPVCGRNGSVNEERYPCRELCIEIQDSCVFEMSLLPLPLQLDCDTLPQFDSELPDSCIMYNSTTESGRWTRL